nr:MAG TPA: hypothetical protein [Caudoviricetes sp.]
MVKVLEEALYLAVLDLTALQDLMNFIAHKTCEEQIDKDVLRIFANSIGVSIRALEKYLD